MPLNFLADKASVNEFTRGKVSKTISTYRILNKQADILSLSSCTLLPCQLRKLNLRNLS